MDMATDAAGEKATPIAVATTEQLTTALRTVISDGLPCDEEAAGVLLQLRSVYARAVVPRNPLSRLQALNELLPRLIARLDDARYREATQVLFGLAPGTRRTSLTSRRRQAAATLDYSAAHFRTDIEADVVHAVAVAVHDDLLRYQSRIKRASESLEPTGDTPSLGPEHINAEEELISRIWQHVYGLRAELIATLRLTESEGLEAQAEDHRQAGLREQEELRNLIAEYRETYGETLIRHGGSEFAVEALERLAGWRG
jgi:hypothetical protein